MPLPADVAAETRIGASAVPAATSAAVAARGEAAATAGRAEVAEVVAVADPGARRRVRPEAAASAAAPAILRPHHRALLEDVGNLAWGLPHAH